MNGARPHLFPVVILALAAFAFLKAGSAWIGFSSADAAQADVAAPAAPSPAAPLPVEADAVERRLLERLAGRRAELDQREAEIETREQLLAVAEGRLEARFATLDAREAEIIALEQRRDERRKSELEQLSSAYERMKPRDAAQIFEALDESILVPVAAGMRTQAIAGVLAEMQPEKARRLTILLADEAEKGAATVAGPQ